MSPSAGGLVVFLLSVQVIQSQDGWRVIYYPTYVCAAKGSTVDISSFYTHPPRIRSSDIKDRFWFTKEKDGEPVDLRTDSEYSDRVTYGCYSNSKDCYLTITDVRESDSAEYKFRFMTEKMGGKYTGSPGVTLSVTGLQVQVRRLNSTWLELTCHSSCVLSDRPKYVWYKNEEIIKTGSSLPVSSASTDRYSCYLRGSCGHGSPAVYGPQRPSVSVSPSAEMLEGDSVTLTCSTDANPAANYTWYKAHRTSDPHLLSKEPHLVFSSIQSSDSGRYFCTAENQLGRKTSDFISIDVKYGPQRPSVKASPSAEMLEGGSVTLTCSADANPAASYTWYKEHGDSPRASGQIFTITDFTAEHSGNYYCEAQNEMGRSNSTFRLITSSVIQSQDGWRLNYYQTEVCAAKGSRVYMDCDITYPPGIRYYDMKDIFWSTKEKDGEPVDLRTDSEYSGRVAYDCFIKSCSLTITDVRESDSAEYKFTFMTNSPRKKYTGSPGVTLSVTGLQVQVRRLNSTWLELTCHSSCVLSRRPEYDWYKNEENIKTGSSLPVSSGSTDRYSCYLRRSWNQRSPAVYGPQRPSVSVSPSAEMLEGDSVTLTCSTDANPAASYTWYKEHEDSPRASGQIFTITDFTAEHSGNYYCEAQNEMGRSNSTLRLIPSSEKGGSTWSTTTTVFASISAVFLLIIILAVLYIR
uniref:Ig-like domain-containing protein n=1 Tax=Gasterosteus aculeatus aculeatus TaxID=481459 RepID=A0AAQ4PWP9_GASAC